MDETKRRYTFGNDEFSLEAAYHDCKLVFDGITDDDSFQEADTGLILYYANEIIYALHKALVTREEGKGTMVTREEGKGTMVTLGDILDLLDVDRESEEIIKIMDDGKEDFRGRVCSPFWAPFENRIVSNIQAVDDELQIWLCDAEVKDYDQAAGD